MYCSKCGKEIKDDASFCPYCGEPVDNNVAGSNNQQQASSNTQTEPPDYTYQSVPDGASANKHRRGPVIVGVIAAILIVCVAFGVVASLGDGNSGQQISETDNVETDNIETDNVETATFYYHNQNGEENNFVLTGNTHYSYNEDGELEKVGNTTYDYELSSDNYIVSQIMNTDDGRKSPQIYQYKYDSNGNLIEEIFTYDGSTIEDKYEYAYDDKNQLISKTFDDYTNGKSKGIPITTEYTYDNNGNMTSETKTGGDYKTYTYENGLKTEMLHYEKKDGELYEGTTYYYDGNGFLIEEIARPYAYLFGSGDNIVDYQRDDNGKVLTKTTTLAGILDSYYENEYDGNGNLLKQSYYSGSDCTLTSVDEYEYQSAAAYFGKSNN